MEKTSLVNPLRIRTLDSKVIFPKKKAEANVYWSILEMYM